MYLCIVLMFYKCYTHFKIWRSTVEETMQSCKYWTFNKLVPWNPTPIKKLMGAEHQRKLSMNGKVSSGPPQAQEEEQPRCSFGHQINRLSPVKWNHPSYISQSFMKIMAVLKEKRSLLVSFQNAMMYLQLKILPWKINMSLSIIATSSENLTMKIKQYAYSWFSIQGRHIFCAQTPTEGIIWNKDWWKYISESSHLIIKEAP